MVFVRLGCDEFGQDPLGWLAVYMTKGSRVYGFKGLWVYGFRV